MPESAPSSSSSPRWWPLGLLLLLAVSLPAAGAFFLGESWANWVETLRARGHTLVLPFIFVGGLVLGLAILPSHALSLLGGFLFGLAGYFWVCLAVMLGTWLHASITRRWPGGTLRQALERSPWGRALAHRLLNAHPWKLWLAVALARLAPQVPFALGSVLAVSCRVPLGPLLAGTWLGMSPRILLVVWMGSQFSQWTPDAPLPASAFAALATGALGLGGLALFSFWLIRRDMTANASFPDPPATPQSPQP